MDNLFRKKYDLLIKKMTISNTYFHTNNDEMRMIKTNKTVHKTSMADVWNDGVPT